MMQACWADIIIEAQVMMLESGYYWVAFLGRLQGKGDRFIYWT